MLYDLSIAVAAAALTSFVICAVLIRTGPVDQPNQPHKLHGRPTPTSGGLGIAFGFTIGLVLLLYFSTLWRQGVSEHGLRLLMQTAGFSYLFLLLGYWDDARPLRALPKMALFAAIAVGAALTMGLVQRLPLGGFVLELGYIPALIGTTLWIFTMVNGVNFMDGANGLAMGSVAVGMGVLAVIAQTQGTPAGLGVCLCALGALIGFLAWNFPGGKLFAGDTGALFAGSVASLASLLVIHRTGISPLIPPIVFFPLLADVLLTLAWRAWKRRSLLDGHSEHAYQIMIHGGMSHAEVALIYWAAMAACGAVAYFAATAGGDAPWVALTVLAFASIVVAIVVRRFAARRGVGGV